MAKLNAFAIDISNTYDSTQPSPFDARQTVDTVADLSKAETWKVTVEGTDYYPIYVGMITSVKADKNLYLLEEFEQTNVQTAPTKLTWKKLGESSGTGAVGPTGPTGPRGETGVAGPKGDKGEIGPKGDKGETGAQGLQGEKGEKGTDGVDAGFGTPTGSVTKDDSTGTPFVTITASGPNTAKIFNFEFSGIKGEKGADGKNGADGAQGPQGPQGPAGKDGTGVTIKGSFVSEEKLKEAHATGETGDAYLVAGNLYVWSGNDWTNVGRIEGPTGPTGEPGKDGAQGPTGPTGDSAYDAWKTLDGNEGKSKEDFIASLKGAKGDAGPQGPAGKDGINGKDGAIGPTGPTGPTGTPASIVKAGTSTFDLGNDILSKNGSNNTATGTFTQKVDTNNDGKEIVVSAELKLDRVIGRGIYGLKLNNNPDSNQNVYISKDDFETDNSETFNSKSSNDNYYDIVYNSKFVDTDDLGFERDVRAIKVTNGRGITNMQPTGSVVAGTNSTLKQSVNVTYSDGSITSFDMPIPSFTAASSGNSLTINGTSNTFKLGVSNVSSEYGYTLSITGTATTIYAPTSVGSTNQILVSKGSGAPQWRNLGDSSIIASESNFGTIKVATAYDSDNLANGLEIDSGILSTVRCSESGYGVVKVDSGNGLSVANGVIAKSADSLSYTCDHKGTNKFTYKLNGANTSTDIDLVIDDGIIE